MSLNPRTTEYPVESLFVDRWSPRAFNAEPISPETVLGFVEAARWAPSAYNSQPWRFIYARRDTPHWERFLGILNEFNRSWAQHASAIVIVLSKETFLAPGAETASPAPWHTFDTGAAWAQFALQASKDGWSTHGMAGFDRARALEELGVPPGYTAELAIAVGKRGDTSSLPEGLQAREQPSPRLPVAQIAAEGRFELD